MRKKLIELISSVLDKYDRGCLPFVMNEIADHLIANGVTVLQWIPASEPPKEPGEYTVAQQHWCDGHLESKKGAGT